MSFKDTESLNAHKLEAARKNLERRVAAIEVLEGGSSTQVEIHFEEVQTRQGHGRELYVQLSTVRNQNVIIPIVYSYKKTTRVGAPAFVPIISTSVTAEGAVDGLASISKTFAERGRLRFEHPNTANFTQPQEFNWNLLGTSTSRSHHIPLFTQTTTTTPQTVTEIPPQWQGPQTEQRMGQRNVFTWAPRFALLAAVARDAGAQRSCTPTPTPTRCAPTRMTPASSL
jgi:hypothetical protein